MASLLRIVYVNWADMQGNRVPAGTPGAKKVITKSAKWYACLRDGKKQMRVPLATDKAASRTGFCC